MSCSPRHAPDPLWHCQPAQVRPSFPACHPHRGTLPLPCLLATPTGRLRRERARGRDAAPPPHARRARSHRDLFLGDVHRDALTLPCGALILSSILSHSQSPLTQLAMHVCFRGGPPKFQNSFCYTPSSLIAMGTVEVLAARRRPEAPEEVASGERIWARRSSLLRQPHAQSALSAG